jgi:beta-N-acetylhexosaminidase
MRLRLFAVLALISLLAVAACDSGADERQTSTTVKPGGQAAPADSLETLLDSLTLEQKAAQVLLVGFPGKEIDPALASLIAEGPPAGVILFGRNVGLPDETQRLTAALQRASAKAPGGIPLLVAVDQEGGSVARLREGVPQLPGARQVAQTQSPDEAERSAYQAGIALGRLGINTNLAPVLDVVDDPTSFLYARSYG